MKVFIFFACYFLPSVINGQPYVFTSAGNLSGTDIILENGKPVHSFLGIPYALPPVFENRFEEPKPFLQWKGTWNATTYSRSCIQFLLPSEVVVGEEDCLYLNIFTSKLPQNSTHSLQDVIVWFHGGSFIQGTGNYLTPEYLLLSQDIVFVSVNYRLGIFGFLSTGDDTVPGNNGLKDQVLALKWIRQNIHHFGGNPRSVTIAGVSAGSSSVHFLLLSPLSDGLFQKAILMSGTSLQPWLLLNDTVHKKTKELASISGCPTHSTKLMVECFKQRPALKIAETCRNLKIWRHLGYLMGPVIETPGENRFLTEHPLKLIRKKKKKIPCLISTTQHEGFVGLNNFVTDINVLNELDKNFDKIFPYMLFFYHKLPESKHRSFSEKIRNHFFNNSEPLISEENYSNLVKVLSDRLITAYVEFAIREHVNSNSGPLYYSIFNYEGEYSMIPVKEKLYPTPRVGHGDDALFITKFLMMGNVLNSPEDKAVSSLLTNIWASFAKTGKPKITSVDVSWPEVSNPHKNGITFLRINNARDIRIERIKNQDSFNFWNNSLNEFPNLFNKFHDEF